MSTPAATPTSDGVTTDATGEASKEVIRQFFAAQMSGDRERLRALFAPDAKVWMAATPPNWGKVGTVDDWLAMDDMAAEIGGGMEEILFGPFFAEGEHVSLQMQAKQRPFVNGRQYTGHYHWYMRVRDGKIIEVRDYLDTLHAVESLLGTPALPEFELGGPHPDRGTNMLDGGRKSLD
jgi:ketosteroid isomerase-like protein